VRAIGRVYVYADWCPFPEKQRNNGGGNDRGPADRMLLRTGRTPNGKQVRQQNKSVGASDVGSQGQCGAVDQRQRPPPAACKKSNRAISSGDGQMDSAGHGGEQSEEGGSPDASGDAAEGGELNNGPTLDPSGALFVFF